MLRVSISSKHFIQINGEHANFIKMDNVEAVFSTLFRAVLVLATVSTFPLHVFFTLYVQLAMLAVGLDSADCVVRALYARLYEFHL
ncbi:hypothetical protein [Paenibacillus sp. V4I7]|uniref:hypothetical protein n=1 Tax=Paenibacillus sp. V4I7 TaxID=3042307 RepID=UPI00278550DF|nr:hypothetical protein [Paenibacillus sp. V4I7]MDQ0901156.1 hypothetical protein [Paenibacillus sp. V4I7]